MATLEEILVDVRAETTLIDGVGTLITGLRKQLLDALKGSISPEQQLEIDQIFATAQANKEKLTTALAAGTDVKPEPIPEPISEPISKPIDEPIPEPIYTPIRGPEEV